MIVTVTSAASDTRLTTPEKVQEELGLERNKDDALIGVLIDGASSAIETYCGRIFPKQTYEEHLPAKGGLYLMLSHYPIVSIDSILYINDPITDWDTIDKERGMVYRKVGWKDTSRRWWTMTDDRAAYDPVPNFVVTYEAGYVLPADEDNRTLPHDVERACIFLVKDWYENRKEGRKIKRKSVDDLTVEYTDEDGGVKMPFHVAGLLAPYRAVV